MTLHRPETLPARPIDTLLAGYAAGTLNAPLHALVGSHLAMSGTNRAFVAAMEELAGGSMDEAASAPIALHRSMLDAIVIQPVSEPAAAPPVDDILPQPLRHLVGRGSSDIAWRFKLPGIREYRIAESEAGEAVLYWVKAGRRLPQHTHEGEEVTLLLQGGFTDPLGHYRRGDIAIADAELDHTPVADKDADCICFAVTDAPLQLTGPVMRLLRKVFHH